MAKSRAGKGIAPDLRVSGAMPERARGLAAMPADYYCYHDTKYLGARHVCSRTFFGIRRRS